MSCDVSLVMDDLCPHCAGILGERTVWQDGTTHNLARMAQEAGIDYVLWRPEECDPPIRTAAEVLPILRVGLELLRSDPVRFRKYDAPNGWGTYPDLVRFVEEYIKACESFPAARIEVSR